MLDAIEDLATQIRNSRILIVDDNEINRLFVEKTLQARGFNKMLSVDSAEKALETMPSFDPDIVILDVLMPGKDGFECCQEIRQQKKYADLPILIQTSITEPERRAAAFEKGATDFVSKPIYPDELSARVMVHLGKRHYLRHLQLYKERVEIELDGAMQLQKDILPKADEIAKIAKNCYLSVASHYQPCSEVGGDFWGIRPLFPHQTALWQVDFSGHGVASALNAFRLQAYLKEHTPLAARPGEYLSHLNDKLLQLLMRGQFATMFYGIVDTQSNKLFYACACSPHPIVLRKATGKAELIDGSGNPLAIGMFLYPTQNLHFLPGDLLLLYSDALIETPNNAGEYITEEMLMALLEKHPDASADEMKDILLDFFRRFGNQRLGDDLTLILCRRTAPQ